MARISELHYANTHANATGVSEFVEVALAPGEDPADFAVGFYSGQGKQGLQVQLDEPGVQASYDADTDEFVYVVSSDAYPFLLTDPNSGGGQNYEAVALADTSQGGEVIDFYDIGGGTQNIVAADGVAAGVTSVNIPTPTSPSKADYSLQFNKDSPDEVTYASVDPGDTGTICFCPGTLVLSNRGWRPVETLRIGDRVLTRDSGAQPIRWIGRRNVCGTGSLAPIEIGAGVLGARRRVLVSPQHRLLVRGNGLPVLTGETEALCPALHLVDGRRIRRRPSPRVTYFHLMFDRHEVIWADGMLAESFFLGCGSISAMTRAMRAEFEALFPGMMARPARAKGFGQLARYGLRRDEALYLAGSLT